MSDYVSYFIIGSYIILLNILFLKLNLIKDKKNTSFHKKFIENKTIEIAPLAYMRGRTLKNAFILLDEAQNTTKSQLKMFLTRLGENSKMIVTGDISQIDLKQDQSSGLIDAKNKLQDINGIGFTLLDSSDVLRHKLVKKILDKYKK